MEPFSPESIEANPRAFWRAELERYLSKAKALMRLQNRTQAHYGYSRTNEVIMRIVNWQRADRAGDFEKASFQTWLDLVDMGDVIVDEYRAARDQHIPVPLLDDEIREYNARHNLDTPEKRLKALAERIDAARGRVRVLADVKDAQGWER